MSYWVREDESRYIRYKPTKPEAASFQNDSQTVGILSRIMYMLRMIFNESDRPSVMSIHCHATNSLALSDRSGREVKQFTILRAVQVVYHGMPHSRITLGSRQLRGGGAVEQCPGRRGVTVPAAISGELPSGRRRDRCNPGIYREIRGSQWPAELDVRGYKPVMLRWSFEHGEIVL